MRVLSRAWLLALPPSLLLNIVSSPPSRAVERLLEIRVDDAQFQVEVAASEQERRQGLMFRTELPDNGGMLFIQPTPGPATFWMKNTYIPLDLLYFDSAGRLLDLHADTPPCVTPACPVYSSDGPVKYILELNAGSARRLGLKPGAQLQLETVP